MGRVGQNMSLVWVALVLLLANGWHPARAQSPGDAAWRFGVIGAADVTALDYLGAGWIQIPFEWAAFQPDGPADWNDGAVDGDLIAAVVESGREVVGVITTTPVWASQAGQPFAVPEGLDLPLDDPGNRWAAFIMRMVTTYAAQGVHHWIISDEPNVRPGEGHVSFAGDVNDYARLLAVAYQAALAADHKAVIHVAAMNWWVDGAAGREPYLARLLRTLAGEPAYPAFPFDVVTVRVTENTAAVGTVLAETRAILEQFDLGAHPIWVEASAWLAGDASLFEFAPGQVADFVVHAVALGMAGGAERIALGGLIEATKSPAGMVRSVSCRPALTAYRTVIEQLAPAGEVRRYPHMAAELIVFEQAERDVYVMWATGEYALQFSVTSGVDGEPATLITPPDTVAVVESRLIDWPAVFRLNVPAARRDSNGFLTVAGTPVILVVDRGEFVRVTYVELNGEWVRLR